MKENGNNRSLTGIAPGQGDAQLAKAAQAGDKQAFVEIVARHQGMVSGVALAILRDFAASEDAAQEAFLTAWKKIGELRELSKLSSWLATIARNTALMHLRKKRPEEPLDPEMDIAGSAFGRPDESAASSEESAMVLAALDALPENYRVPLVLFYREDHSVAAVAEALDLSEDAVKQRLSRGREMLRKRVAGVIDTVLGRTIPTAVFTMTIAAAIGALVAPTALAASVFSAAATTTAATAASTSVAHSAVATTAEVVTATATTMSTAKLSLAAAAIAAICIPVGYTARLSTEPAPKESSTVVSIPEQPAASSEPEAEPELPDSPLVAEWKRMLEEYGSTTEDMKQLHGVLMKMDDPFRKRAFLSALIAEWAKVDPEGGLAFFREKKQRGWKRYLFVQELIKRDGSGAIDVLMASGSGWEGIARNHLMELARRAPGRIPELASKLPKPGSVWDTKVRDAFALIAGDDLAGSRAAAEAMTGASRQQALSGVAKAWAEKDGEAALAWAKDQEEGELRFEVMRAALIGWASVEPAEALNRVGMIPAGGDGMYFASSTGAKVLRAAAEGDFEGTVAWLRENPDRMGREDLLGMSNTVSSRLLADAVGFLSQYQASGSLGPLMPAIGSALLNDASGTRMQIWNWLESQPEQEHLDRLRQNVLNGLGWQDPQNAIRIVSDMPEGQERTQAMERTANAILNGGNNAGALDPLLEEVSPEWRTALVQSGFNTLRPEQFHDAELWLSRLEDIPPESRTNAVQSLARAWSGEDPAASAAWVASLENSAERIAGMGSVTAEWAKVDAYAVGEWITGLPAGEDRDAAAAGLVRAIAQTDPQDAWEWVESIETAASRRTAAQSVLESIRRRDPEEALQWLENSSLPEADRAALREIYEGGVGGSPTSNR